MATTTYTPPAGTNSSNSVGATAQQVGRVIDYLRGGVAADTHGTVYEVGTGAAEVSP